MRSILTGIVIIILNKGLAFSQENIFQQDWKPINAEIPTYEELTISYPAPGVIISVDFLDTLTSISPYLTGFNQPVHAKGAFNEAPQAVRHVRNFQPEVLRYPGGTAAMSFFWDRSKSDGPPKDVDTYIRSDEVDNSFRFGMTGGDFFSLESYYAFVDSVKSLNSIIVINYGYARYGRSENPVGQAAHYAAEWVRYDRGRTKFWEIGNEISGRWTPGHRIDTSKNKDGQPEYISGTLYAQHFKIFVDSMRKAASETGSEIKIGGVLSHTEDSWNREFLENASNIADFLIIHEYYGNEGTEDPLYAVRSSDALVSHKENADADIDAYSFKDLPVVLTEWNTKDAGQADRCIYGLSNMKAIKNIVESDYGLSCRHTLLQKNERGLINTAEEYNPDLGVWQPRASYFYFYYLDKTLGDHYYKTSVNGNENIEAIASSFSSGEKGLVVLNYSDKNEYVGLDLHNFRVTPQYYQYTLTPDKMDPFSSKVKVNGQSNDFYTSGGPFNYEDIKAYSCNTEGLVEFNSAPYSATYLILEGEEITNENSVNVEVNIFGKIRDSVFAMPGAFISLNSSSAFTDNEGIALFNLENNSYFYSVRKSSFKILEKNLQFNKDTALIDTLEIDQFNVIVELIDASSEEPIENVEINLDEHSGSSSAEGIFQFENITGGECNLVVDNIDYFLNETISIFSDTTLRLNLERRLYNLNVMIRDSVNKKPLVGVNIITGKGNFTSDINGSLGLELESGAHELFIQDEDYRNQVIELELSKDSSLTIYLKPLYAELKFQVTENSVPLNNVLVIVNNEEKNSNSLGICRFSRLATGVNYNYVLQKTGFQPVDSSVHLIADTTIELTMIPATDIEYNLSEKIKIYPNPASNKVSVRSREIIHDLKIMDISGREIKRFGTIEKSEISIDTQDWEEGIYLIHVRLQDYWLNKFLIIQK